MAETVGTGKRMVGPIVRGMDGELADALIVAIETDNPDVDVLVDDAGGYIRIGVEQRCRVTRASLEEELGHTFSLSELEPSLSAFAGRMHVSDDEIVWYLERQD